MRSLVDCDLASFVQLRQLQIGLISLRLSQESLHRYRSMWELKSSAIASSHNTAMCRRNPKRQCRSKDRNIAIVPEDSASLGRDTANESIKIPNGDPVSQHPEPIEKEPPRYIYQPLGGPDKIRTLKLHATKERIECTLQQISFSEGGYQALSYVWGNPEKHFNAAVLDEDGHEVGHIPLTVNVQRALCDLRDAEELTSKIFWIDQICIDQEGEEKSRQVALMGKIYRNASRVITYVGPAALGEEEEKSGTALLKLLDRHFSDNYALILKARYLRRATQIKSTLPVVTLPKEMQDNGKVDDRERGWRWLLQVAYGEWTQRLWIVQEQLLNSEIAMLHGSLLFSWNAVAMMPVLFALDLLPRWYLYKFWRENRADSVESLLQIESSMYNLCATRGIQEKTKWLNDAPDLLQNMTRYELQHCWDVRDRIFAQLAISCDATRLGIIPDYTSTSSHVFQDTSVRMLLNYKSLPSLAFACRWANSKSLSENQSENSLPTHISDSPSWQLRPPSLPLPVTILFEISTPHPRTSVLGCPPRFLLNDTVLVLRGSFVDRISMTTPVIFHSESFMAGLLDVSYIQTLSRRLTSWLEILLHLGITVKNAACLCRALIATSTWFPIPQHGVSVEGNTTFHCWSYLRLHANDVGTHGSRLGLDVVPILKQYDSLIQGLAGQLGGIIDLESFQPGNRPGIAESEAFIEIDSRRLLLGRSFCVTENGRVCNAMNQPEKGDVVAAFAGADRLFILRPVGERYRLIGDAYVDGLMKGEAYEDLDPDEVDYDIELV